MKRAKTVVKADANGLITLELPDVKPGSRFTARRFADGRIVMIPMSGREAEFFGYR
jgi:hypothetical protein